MKKVVKSKDERAIVDKELIRQLRAKGDGVFVLTELNHDENYQPQLSEVFDAGKISHSKFAKVIQEFAESKDLEIEVKTIFIINKREK
jgi:hypothetical protein